MKHTPGKWDIHTSFDNIEIHQLADEHGVVTIADIPTDSGLSNEERMANARLIAHAPEMLEALKTALTQLDNGQAVEAAMLDTLIVKVTGVRHPAP